MTMLAYYLDLARRSFKRNIALTTLMIVAIAFGVGASMTTLTVLHVLAADPIPAKSHELYVVQLEPRRARDAVAGEEPPEQLTRLDAEALLRAGKAPHQVMMTGGSAAVEPQRAGLEPFFVDSRYTSWEFFALFDVPFRTGRGWTDDDDAHAARVAVIARSLAEKLYGTPDAVGKQLRVEGADLRVVGVIDDWSPVPSFFDLNMGNYGRTELLYVPFSTSRDLSLRHTGDTTCWEDFTGDPTVLGTPCYWLQYWADLPTTAQADAYRDYLVQYSLEQKRAGRFEREPNVRLRNVTDWLAFKRVVPDDAKLQMWVALGFLLVCLVNTVGLLLTKFMRRSAEIGVRRALGASKGSIFVQLLVEAGAIGLVGGLLGLGLACLGLWAVRQQPAAYATLAHLDLPMLAATFGLAVLASVLAGLLPAWRGCQVTPAIQLKSH